MVSEAQRRIYLATSNTEALNLLASNHAPAPGGPPSWKRFQQNNPRSLLLKSMNQYGKVLVIASILVLVFFALQIKVEVGIFKKDKEFDGISNHNGEVDVSSILEDTEWKGYSHYVKRIKSLGTELVKESQHLKLTGRGPYGFVEFSSYRVGLKSFAAVGFGAQSLRTSAEQNIKGCWWEEDENEIIFGDTKVFYADDKNKNSYSIIIIFCFLKNETGVNGGKGFVTIDSETIALYREKPEEKAKFNTFNLTSLKYSFTMCPASIVKEEIEPRMIVEYIEYHKLLGIPHFLMYDAGGFTEVSANNLDSHLRSGTLEVVPFRGVDRFDIWEGGLLLAQHDCLYRSRMNSRWILVSNWDEYLVPPPKHTVSSFMKEYESEPWVTHGTLVWSIEKCRQGPPLFGGRIWSYSPSLPFAIERMVFHWPHIVCHGSENGFNAELCLGGVGERRYIADPRLVFTLLVFEVGLGETGGKHLKFSDFHHQRFPFVHLRNNFTSTCSSVIKQDDKVDWWVRDDSQAAFTRHLREGDL